MERKEHPIASNPFMSTSVTEGSLLFFVGEDKTRVQYVVLWFPSAVPDIHKQFQTNHWSRTWPKQFQAQII